MSRKRAYGAVRDRQRMLVESSALPWRCGFLTLAEAEQCIEDLRAMMAACGALLVRWEAEVPGMDLRAMLRASKPPSR